MVVFMLVGGVWADRLPREALMIGSSLVRLVTQATLGILLIAGSATIWELVVLQIVHGAATAFFRPASTGIVPDTVSPTRLQQANALMWGAIGTAGLAGPAAAGVLLATHRSRLGAPRRRTHVCDQRVAPFAPPPAEAAADATRELPA